MVNSYVYYTGDGSTNSFQITFDYLSKEFVQVYLDGVLLDVEADYIFAGERTIIIPTIPGAGSVIFIRRVTSKDRLVEFRDASILVAKDLDVSALQAIHIAEEANDNIQNVIQADPNGNFDALTRRIVNLGEPVDSTDAVTKSYVDTRLAADVGQAEAARDAAIVAQGLSEAARDAAQGFANAANISAGLADVSAQDAAVSALEAQDAADSIGVLQARGVLLIGEDTITLPWVYNPLLKNVAVYLNGVKQDADTALVYTNANTVTLTEAVTETTNWEVISVTLAGDSTLSGYVDQCQTIVNNAALSNLPVGAIITLTGNTPAPGTVAAQGELLSRAAYPDLWAFAQASGNLSADDASWTKGQYSPGDGATTFRVPNLQDQFIRGASGTRAVGNGEEDQNKAHNHFVGLKDSGYAGASVVGSTSTRMEVTYTYVNNGYITLTDGGDETRPKNVAYLICIKAYDVISDPNVLNAVGVVNEINRLESDKLAKTDIVAPGDAPMYACRAWVNFDGTTTPPTIRASGNVSSVTRNGVGDYTVNFTTNMPDANYAVVGSAGFNNNAVNPNNTGREIVINSLVVGSVRIGTPNASGDGSNALMVHVAVFR